MMFSNAKRIVEINEKTDRLLVIIENQNQEIISLKGEVSRLQDKEQQLLNLLHSEVEKFFCEGVKNTDTIIENFNIQLRHTVQEIFQKMGEMKQDVMNLETMINLNSKNIMEEIKKAEQDMNTFSENEIEEMQRVGQDINTLFSNVSGKIQILEEEINTLSKNEIKEIQKVGKEMNILSEKIVKEIQSEERKTDILSDNVIKTLNEIKNLIDNQRKMKDVMLENNEKIDYLDSYLRMLLLNNIMEQLPNTVD